MTTPGSLSFPRVTTIASLGFMVFFFFCIIVKSSTAPDFDWVKTVSVSDDLTVSLSGLKCGTNIPRLQLDGWTKSVVDPKVDRYTKNGQTVVINQTEEATGAATGYFSLRYTDKTGSTVDIKGRLNCP